MPATAIIRRRAVIAYRKLVATNVMSGFSMQMSALFIAAVDDPATAIDTVERNIAAASLRPLPTMATGLKFDASRRNFNFP